MKIRTIYKKVDFWEGKKHSVLLYSFNERCINVKSRWECTVHVEINQFAAVFENPNIQLYKVLPY